MNRVYNTALINMHSVNITHISIFLNGTYESLKKERYLYNKQDSSFCIIAVHIPQIRKI